MRDIHKQRIIQTAIREYKESVHWQIQQKCRPGKKAIPDGP